MSTDLTERNRIEQELRESEERFRLAFDEAPIGMALVTLDGHFFRVNNALCRYLGYTRDELNGLTFQDLTHRDDLETNLGLHGKLAHGEVALYKFEKRYVRKDGAIVDGMISGSLVRDSKGAPRYFIGQIEDITERKRAERAVRLSEARFSGIVSISADAIISIDEGFRILIFNDGAEKIFGYSKAEAIGAPLDLLIPERLRVAHRQHIEKFATGEATGRPMGERPAVAGRRKNGEEFPAEATISKIEVGGERLLTVALRDITERKRIEDERAGLLEREHALREEADGARKAAEAAAGALNALGQITETALASLDLDTLLQTLVRRIKEAFAVDTVALVLLDDEKRELVLRAAAGLDEAMVQGLRFPADRGIAGQIVAERRPLVIDDLRASDLASPLLRDRGVRSLVGAPLRLRDRTLGVVHVGSLIPRRFTDDEATLLLLAADRIAVAIEHARLYEQTRQANQARDEILGIVAHDLRNPLNAIVLSAQVMRRERGPVKSEGERGPVEVILSAARRVDRLIQDLLDVRRLEAGELTLTLACLAVEPLIAEAFDLARPLASAKSLHLETRLAPVLASIHGDHHCLLQVLGNLIGNAVKFTGEGGTITVAAEQVGPDVQISVADTGAGIREDHLPHIFDRFWRATASDRRSAGLGLSIVSGLVRKHGGRIWVESTLGAGSTFFFTIPAAQ